MGGASSRTARRRRSVEFPNFGTTASRERASTLWMDNNIPTQEGITLRVLLSRLLNCQPMRCQQKIQRRGLGDARQAALHARALRGRAVSTGRGRARAPRGRLPPLAAAGRAADDESAGDVGPADARGRAPVAARRRRGPRRKAAARRGGAPRRRRRRRRRGAADAPRARSIALATLRRAFLAPAGPAAADARRAPLARARPLLARPSRAPPRRRPGVARGARSAATVHGVARVDPARTKNSSSRSPPPPPPPAVAFT